MVVKDFIKWINDTIDTAFAIYIFDNLERFNETQISQWGIKKTLINNINLFSERIGEGNVLKIVRQIISQESVIPFIRVGLFGFNFNEEQLEEIKKMKNVEIIEIEEHNGKKES